MAMRTPDEQGMLDALANFFGKHGVDGFEFADEHGRTVASFPSQKPPINTKPLIGFGDEVKVGDRVVIGIFENGHYIGVEFSGNPVTILNYGDLSEPYMLVDATSAGQGNKVSFKYNGINFRREFKRVDHGA